MAISWVRARNIALPKLYRLRSQGAIDNWHTQVIRNSEHQARDALERFRQSAYQKAIQLKIDAAEAAFPPSDQRGDGQAKAS